MTTPSFPIETRFGATRAPEADAEKPAGAIEMPTGWMFAPWYDNDDDDDSDDDDDVLRFVL